MRCVCGVPGGPNQLSAEWLAQYYEDRPEPEDLKCEVDGFMRTFEDHEESVGVHILSSLLVYSG